MNVDDEIFLSAYLDGELNSEQRQRVETAMLSDARLLDHLHALAAVREMVASLPRVSLDRDLSGIVTSTIERRRAGILRLPGIRPVTTTLGARAGYFVAAAAVLVLVVLNGRERPHGPQPEGPLAVQPVERGHEDPRPVVGDETEDPFDINDMVAGNLGQSHATTKVAPEILAPAISNSERLQDAEQRHVRDLLDRTDPARVLVVRDSPGSDAPSRVGKLLEQTSLRNARFGRIRISQGIQIDPKHPGAATVFAVVMDESELRDFRVSLASAFRESLVEAEARPEVVTRLAGLTDVSVVQARAVAGLRVPDGPTRAIRTEDKGAVVKKSLVGPDGSVYRHSDREANPDGPPAVADTRPSRSDPDSESGENPLSGRRGQDRVVSSRPTSNVAEKSIAVDRRPSELLVLIWVTSSPFGDSQVR
jgi:hypothetical protein